MGINVLKSQDTRVSYSPSTNSADASRTWHENTKSREDDFGVDGREPGQLPINVGEKIKQETYVLNKFMQIMTADLQFEVHEKTNQLMVKLVDLRSNKVLREFPPHEFLDMIARIQDYVGVLLDKKA